jgi:4-hydroxybenzoate polyprenyltransferase
MVWIGYTLHRGAFYYGGLVVAAGLAAYHLVLIRNREPGKCFRAFLNNHWLGFAIFAGVALDFGYRSAWPRV